MADDFKNHPSDTMVQPAEKGVTAVYRTKKELIFANILGGIAWGFGTVIGATIVVAIVLVGMNYLGGVPIIGSFINEVNQAVKDAQR